MAYKSEYYDPQKAHEYYEKHKKSKGKRSKLSTAGMSKKQKNIASYVKSEIANRRKTATDTHTANTKKAKETLKNEMSNKIADIRKRISAINNNSALSNNQKAELRGKLKEEFAKVKENYESKSKELSESSKKEQQNIKNKYKKEYEKEFKKIKSDKNLKKKRR